MSHKQQPRPRRLWASLGGPLTSWVWCSFCSFTRAWYIQSWSTVNLFGSCPTRYFARRLKMFSAVPWNSSPAWKTRRTQIDWQHWNKLQSLEPRPKWRVMIDLYKYLHGIHKANNPQFKLAQGKGNSSKLITSRCRLSTSSFFSEHVVTSWNSPPELVVMASSVDSLGSWLENHWSNVQSMFDQKCFQWHCQPLMQSNIY